MLHTALEFLAKAVAVLILLVPVVVLLNWVTSSANGLKKIFNAIFWATLVGSEALLFVGWLVTYPSTAVGGFVFWQFFGPISLLIGFKDS
jgi:hypothetical protein